MEKNYEWDYNETKLFQATEKVDLKKAIDKLSDKSREGLPELTGNTSWYTEPEDHDVETGIGVSHGPQAEVVYGNSGRPDPKDYFLSNRQPKECADLLALAALRHKDATYSFKKLNRKQITSTYNREMKCGEKMSELEHPQCGSPNNNSVKEILDTWRNYSGQCFQGIFTGNTYGVDFDKITSELDKRFDKLKFNWKDGYLQVSWKNNILEQNAVMMSRIDLHIVSDIAKVLTRITNDKELLEELIVNIIGRTLEEIF